VNHKMSGLLELTLGSRLSAAMGEIATMSLPVAIRRGHFLRPRRSVPPQSMPHILLQSFDNSRDEFLYTTGQRLSVKPVPEFKYALAVLNDIKRPPNHGGTDVA
jgi:hypothetical protein